MSRPHRPAGFFYIMVLEPCLLVGVDHGVLVCMPLCPACFTSRLSTPGGLATRIRLPLPLLRRKFSPPALWFLHENHFLSDYCSFLSGISPVIVRHLESTPSSGSFCGSSSQQVSQGIGGGDVVLKGDEVAPGLVEVFGLAGKQTDGFFRGVFFALDDLIVATAL